MRVWMENRYLGTGVGYVHGYREAKFSLRVLHVVLETTLDAKVKKAYVINKLGQFAYLSEPQFLHFW